MNRKGLKLVFITLRIWLMNYLSALLWIMTLLSDVLIACLMWISETPFRKSHLSMQFQRSFTSLLSCAFIPSSSPCSLSLVYTFFSGDCNPLLSSAASSSGPWVAEGEELESAGAAGSPRGLLGPRWAGKLLSWARLGESFFSRCFGNQPKWY